MFHDQMSRYYGFLSLEGESEAHRGRYADESKGYQKLNKYYMEHYGKLIQPARSPDPKKIPENWYRYKRDEVDVSTKRLAIQTGIEGWIAWEKDTKELYERSAKDLFDQGHLASYKFIMEYVKDVDEELAKAEEQRLWYQSTGYDMPFIMDLDLTKN